MRSQWLREKADKTNKERDSIQQQEERAPEAVRKMEKWERKVASLTVPEIVAILYGTEFTKLV